MKSLARTHLLHESHLKQAVSLIQYCVLHSTQAQPRHLLQMMQQTPCVEEHACNIVLILALNLWS